MPTALTRVLNPPVNSLFPQDVIAHFSYHKCLTVYYQRIMSILSAEFGFAWQDFNDDISSFHEAVVHGKGKRVLVLNGRDYSQWAGPQKFCGSHFIRDPRDLVVSGYHYHLWTSEEWCRSPDFDWDRYAPPQEFRWVEPDPDKRPRNISYQSYLNSLDAERGMLLEMVFLQTTFDQLRNWDFNNPSVLELRYEEIVGDEETAFGRLFDHYGFHRRLRKRGVKVARALSLENQAKADRTHVRCGQSRQWTRHFTPTLKDAFKQRHGDLLIRLRYEQNLGW